MKPKQADILRHASTLFNREGYQSPSIERIAEHAGISKMTFYRYYADKEALILAILKQKESEFMQDLAQITADKASAREKLFAVFDYYHRWFTCETFHGCMFTRALFEYGASSPAIREQCSRFKSALSGQSIDFSIANMCASKIGLKAALSVSTFTKAGSYMKSVQDAIEVVSKQRSAMGAIQNRLEHTIANLDTTSENTQSAESRIRDTDMASEMVTYSKNNILAQAGQSMLAQANQSTQGVLSLLQ